MKRFFDTDIWDKEWFMSLPDKGKLFFQFLFSKCDAAGVWTPNFPLASTYVGKTLKKDDLKLLGAQVEVLQNGKVFIPEFVSFQYGMLTESCMPHRKVINLLKSHGLYERVLIGYQKGINTLQDKEEEKEEDKEEEEDKGGAGEKSKPIPLAQIVWEAFAWPHQPLSDAAKLVWLQMCATAKWKKKEDTALEASLKKLVKYEEAFVIELMTAAIAGSYQGVVFSATDAEYERWKKQSRAHPDDIPSGKTPRHLDPYQVMIDQGIK